MQRKARPAASAAAARWASASAARASPACRAPRSPRQGRRLLRHVRDLVQQQELAGRRIRGRREVGVNEDAAVERARLGTERLGDAPCLRARLDADVAEWQAQGALRGITQRCRQRGGDDRPARDRQRLVAACHETPRLRMDGSAQLTDLPGKNASRRARAGAGAKGARKTGGGSVSHRVTGGARSARLHRPVRSSLPGAGM